MTHRLRWQVRVTRKHVVRPARGDYLVVGRALPTAKLIAGAGGMSPSGGRTDRPTQKLWIWPSPPFGTDLRLCRTRRSSSVGRSAPSSARDAAGTPGAREG